MSYFTEFTPWLAGFLVALLFAVHSRRLSAEQVGHMDWERQH